MWKRTRWLRKRGVVTVALSDCAGAGAEQSRAMQGSVDVAARLEAMAGGITCWAGMGSPFVNCLKFTVETRGCRREKKRSKCDGFG